MFTPRQYLSYSQMTTFEMSQQKFLDLYVYGNKQRISRNIAYGSLMANSLELDETTGDPVLDLVMARLPKFERMDEVIEDREKGVEVYDPHDKKKYKVPFLKDRKEIIPLLAKPDTAKENYEAFKEYKTSIQKWTQKKADESGQITFYVTVIWLKTGKIPQDIELVNAVTEYDEDGKVVATGEIVRLRTNRTLVDVIRMTTRIKKAWSGIKTLVANELV